MSVEEIDRQLAELGDVAQRLPLPPLPEIHRRAARRHRARIARRTAGVAVAATLVSVIAFGGSHLAADRDVVPATTPPRGGPGCVETAAPPGTLDAKLRLLPDHIPAGTVFQHVAGDTTSPGCGGAAAGAWAADPATSQILRAITFTPLPAYVGRKPGPGVDPCLTLSDGSEGGTCTRARITGGERWSWHVAGLPAGGTAIAWLQDGFVWRATAAGLSSTELDAALERLRVSGDRVVEGTLPPGLAPWTAPGEARETHSFTADYQPPPSAGNDSQGDPDRQVTLVVTDDPWEDPFIDPMSLSANPRPGPASVRLVELDGRQALWRQDVAGSSGGGLVWQTDGGVNVMLVGDHLTLEEALRVARTVRPVASNDERLTCDPDKNPWGSCDN
jgi:hypothetical protein